MVVSVWARRTRGAALLFRQLPSAILLHPNDYIGSGLNSECVTMVIGHRYRGVRLFVSREFESQVVSRVDLQLDVGEFMPVSATG